MLVRQTLVLSWSKGGKAHRGGLLVGVVGTKTELSLLLVCGNEKLGKLPLVVVCGNAKGNLSRQGSIITSLQVTLDCSAVSQLARLDPSTVSAASVSAEKNMTHIVIAEFSDGISLGDFFEKFESFGSLKVLTWRFFEKLLSLES